MDFTSLPDDDLVRKSGEDVDAFGELYKRHFDDLKRIIQAKFNLSAHNAEDIAQKAFIKAHDNIGNFHFKSSFKTWLFSIARNAAIDLVRSKEYNCVSIQSMKVSDSSDAEIDFEDTSTAGPYEELASKDSGVDFSKKIEAAKALLSKKQQEIFEHVFVNRMDYKEVADIMGCPIGTVMSRVYFTRKRLERMKKNILAA